jgi:hypothetical protein
VRTAGLEPARGCPQGILSLLLCLILYLSGSAKSFAMHLKDFLSSETGVRYVHTEDDPVRAAAETVATRRRIVISGQRTTPQAENSVAKTQFKAPVTKPANFDDGRYSSNSKTKVGNDRPFQRPSEFSPQHRLRSVNRRPNWAPIDRLGCETALQPDGILGAVKPKGHNVCWDRVTSPRSINVLAP